MNPIRERSLPTKATRFNIRATGDEKTLVEQAARSLHMTASQFVIQAALRSAEEVLADQTRFVLSSDKWTAFAAALDRPAREIPALKHAASKPSPFSER
jgi:uncharacterized protein (DUF1778 family)